MSSEEIQPFSSTPDNRRNGAKQVTLEEVIEQCGSFGRYQMFHACFLLLFPIASGVVNYYFIYGAAEPNFNCRPTHLMNSTYRIEIDRSQCFYKRIDENNQTHQEICSQWSYDRTIFGKTFTEEANLVCQHRLYRSLLATALQIGAMFIFFSGQITDLIGRRRSLHLLVSLFLLSSLITQTILQFVPMTIDQKLVLVLINQFIWGIDAYMVSFLLLMELSTSIRTNLIGNLALVAASSGEFVVTIMAYFCRDWLRLKWLATFYILIASFYLYFVPESPRWLLTKGRYAELEQLLSKMARINGRNHHHWYQLFRHVVRQDPHEKSFDQQTEKSSSFTMRFIRIVRNRTIMSRFLISGFIGFITLFLYIKVAYSLGAMNEIDPYLSVIIGGFVEIAGCMIGCALMIKFGRKTVLNFFIVLLSLCFALTPHLQQSNNLILILISQLSKFSISGAVCVTYIFVPELFPTSIRGTGMGFFVLISRIGSALGPTVDSWIPHQYVGSSSIWYFYSILTLITVTLTFFLPETRNIPMKDTIEN